jgi:hypothetical protein
VAGEAARFDACGFQGSLERFVAGPADRVVEAGPIDGGGSGFGDQSGQAVERLALSQDQAAALGLEALREGLDRQAEAEPGGGPLPGQNLVVEEDRDHRAACGAGL